MPKLPTRISRRSFIAAIPAAYAFAHGFSTEASVYSLRADTAAGDLLPRFASPPDVAKPWCYWHWMNGNISRTGITADLESMQKQGIGGVGIVDLKGDGECIPEGPVAFDSAEFFDMMRFAVAEASRLGMKVMMNPGTGWSSGGPWITPDLSMQHVVTSETFVTGPTSVDVLLPKPPSRENYYKDIAVLAFPAVTGDDASTANAAPIVTTSTGAALKALPVESNSKTQLFLPNANPGGRGSSADLTFPKDKQPFVQLEFPQSYRGRTLTVSVKWDYISCELQASDDGALYRTVCSFHLHNEKVSVPFETPACRFYRVVFTKYRGWGDQIQIAEIAIKPQRLIDNVEGKMYEAEYGANKFDAGPYPTLDAGDIIDRAKVVDLTETMSPDGHLKWDAPPGRWTILRVGHTSNGSRNRVARKGGEGLESDKLNPNATDAQWNAFMLPLLKELGPMAGAAFAGTWIDSWENGVQNWTGALPQEFKKRRGYEISPFLPILSGRYVGSASITERFLWDFRRTIQDLVAENYSGRYTQLAHQSGLFFGLEPYAGGLTGDFSYCAAVDMPMSEFWVGAGAFGSGAWDADHLVSSMGHMYGRRVIEAESFTSAILPFQVDPYLLKSLGDRVFTEGINHYILHSFVHQPFLNRYPGMTYDKWGTQFSRTTTWWNQSAGWLQYVARCQFMLRQGLPVADVVGYDRLDLPIGYAFDLCDEVTILSRMSVVSRRIMLPDGMSYRALTLPQDGQMTPQLLAKIRDMVRAGATVVGPKPTHSPTLQGFPTADADFATMANEIWGDCDGKLVKEHAYGQGRVVWGRPLGDVLGESNIRQDFVYTVGDASTPLLFAHRHLDEADVYFVCNQREQATNAQCSFRVAGKTPEFWRPDTGEVERPAVYSEQNGIITLPVHFEPMGSVFVVFRASNTAADARVVSLTPGSEILFPTTKPAAFTDVFRNFTMEIWANPRMPIVLPAEAASGIIQEGRNDAIFPVPGHELFGWGHAGCGMSVGTNGVVVLEHSAGYLAPVLVQELPIMGWTHLVLVYEEGTPTLYVNGKRTRQGLHGPKIVHPGDLRRPFNGDRRGFAVVGRSLTGSEVAALPDSLPPPPASEMQPPIQLSRGGKGSLIALVTGAASGDYVATTADGALHRFHVDSLPRPMDVAGPWQVTFPANWGAPPHVTFDRLISWPDSADAGVRYFSGTAAYHNTIDIPAGLIRPGQRLMLDLGDVMNMARLFVNGKDLGVLWKRLFQADITGAVHAGANNIRIDITNLWQNRMVGDEQLPVDIPRAAGGQLGVSTWPNWFLDGKPSPTGRFTFCTYAPFTKNTPLQKAGLLGPVTLRVIRLIGVQ